MWFCSLGPRFAIQISAAVLRQVAALAARHESSQTVRMRLDFGVNGLCFEHGLELARI
jgi:hypothetical protein